MWYLNLKELMRTSRGTHASPVDLIPADRAPTISRHSRNLSTVYTQLVKVESHHFFVSTCLHRHCTPRGLHIKLKPSVQHSPRQEFPARLENEWFKVIKWVSIGLLAALKCYHRCCAQDLRLRATRLENSITSCTQETAYAINSPRATNKICK